MMDLDLRGHAWLCVGSFAFTITRVARAVLQIENDCRCMQTARFYSEFIGCVHHFPILCCIAESIGLATGDLSDTVLKQCKLIQTAHAKIGLNGMPQAVQVLILCQVQSKF